MTKHLDDLTGDLVPLGLIWEQPCGDVLLKEIQRDLHAGEVPAYGRRPGSLEFVRITVPDSYVFGLGHQGTGRYDAEISAERDVDPWLIAPANRKKILADRYENVAIRRTDWEQKLATHLGRADIQEWANIFYGTAIDYNPDLQTERARTPTPPAEAHGNGRPETNGDQARTRQRGLDADIKSAV